MGRAKEIIVKVIPAKIANEFVKKHHYSGKVVPNSKLHFGCFHDSYPIEMDYPQFTWIALKRLLDDDNLIEVYSDNNFDFPEEHQNED